MKLFAKISLAVLVLAIITLNVLFVNVAGKDKEEASIQQGKEIAFAEDGLEDGVDDADDESDIPIAGYELEKASAVALKHIGKGKVTDSEVGDEEGYYEIEITLDNGKEVDVHLNENFEVLSEEWN